MVRIPLEQVPNQKFNIVTNGTLFDITLKFCVNIMAADITINKKRVLSGLRVQPNIPIIPYEYLRDGNFIILCLNDEYPNYEKFGVSQVMFYATKEEIEAIRARA